MRRLVVVLLGLLSLAAGVGDPGAGLWMLVTSGLLPSAAHAQGGILLQGVADAEGWSTNKTSNLLTRNAA